MSIFATFTPNIEKKEVLQSIQSLTFNLPSLRKGSQTQQLKNYIENYFNKSTTLFDSGRSSLFAILKCLQLPQNAEVLLTGYTCNVVINSIKKANLSPIYVDTEKDSTKLSLESLESKITKNSKVLIIQHTFGFPDELDEIQKIAKKHDLILIEDLAHALSAQYKSKKLGTQTDIAFLSFGSAKVISSSRGGAAITSNPDLHKKLNEFEKTLPQMSVTKVMKHHLKHVIFAVAKPLYFTLNIGKAILFLSRKIHLTPDVISQEEREGITQKIEVQKMPNSLAKIALTQFKKLDQIKSHRHKIAKIYQEKIKTPLYKCDPNATYFRFPILVDDPKKTLQKLKNNKIILDSEWSYRNIVPIHANMKATGYKKGDTPNAEKLATQIISLPTYSKITPEKAEKIIKLINE